MLSLKYCSALTLSFSSLLLFYDSVLVHSGGVQGGHYYAFIRPKLSDMWYVFLFLKNPNPWWSCISTNAYFNFFSEETDIFRSSIVLVFIMIRIFYHAWADVANNGCLINLISSFHMISSEEHPKLHHFWVRTHFSGISLMMRGSRKKTWRGH